MLNALRDHLAAFVAKARSVLAPFSSLEIVGQDDDRLILKNNSGQFVISKNFAHITSGAHVIARFDDIESVGIARHRPSDKAPPYWAVSLCMKGSAPPITIGHSLDDVDASIVAARISTYTGKSVRAL